MNIAAKLRVIYYAWPPRPPLSIVITVALQLNTGLDQLARMGGVLLS